MLTKIIGNSTDMKELMSSKRSQGSIDSDDDNGIYGAEEKLLASLNVEKCKANCLRSIPNSTSIPGKNTDTDFVCIVCDQFIIGKKILELNQTFT